MRTLRDMLGIGAPLVGLEDVLQQVADGQMMPDEAARRIRASVAKPPLSVLLVSRVFIIIGGCFALIGVGFAAYSVVFASGAERVEGTVTEMVGGNRKAPVVEYQVDGKSYVFRDSISTAPPAYDVGDKVVILYRPDDPRRAQIDSFVGRWLFAVIFTSLGLSAAAIGVLCLIASRFVAGGSAPRCDPRRSAESS
jgi:hypothetical protein